MNPLLNEPSTTSIQSLLVAIIDNLVRIGADRCELSMILFNYLAHNKEYIRTSPQLYEMVKDSILRFIFLEIPTEIDLLQAIEDLTGQKQTEKKEQLMSFSVSLLQLLYSLNP